MAAKLTKIGRLTARIEAAAGRLRRPLRLEDLTDEANERLDRRCKELEAKRGESIDLRQANRCRFMTDDQLIRELLSGGWLTPLDIKPRDKG
jgi:hypothetical protein